MKVTPTTMTKKPFVFHPACNPQEGSNHRTVTIRYQGNSVRIKCQTREQADKLGKALIGVFNRYLDTPTP
jgi:hypothetical protein